MKTQRVGIAGLAIFVLSGVLSAQAPPPSSPPAPSFEETLAINQLFVGGRNWESNERRARLNRGQLLRHLNEAKARGESPRVLMKFGRAT